MKNVFTDRLKSLKTERELGQVRLAKKLGGGKSIIGL